MKENFNNLIRIIISALLFFIAIILSYVLNIPSWGNLIIYLAIYFLIGYDIILRAVKNIARGQIFDENFLMVIATIGAFAVGEYPEGVAVMVFYQVGEYFQSYAVGKSRKSISDLMDIRPDNARLIKNGVEQVVAPEDVQIGDTVIVKVGERIPLDGKIVSGESSLDTSALTGESVPLNYKVGDSVLSGSINLSGVIMFKAEKLFYDSTVSKILDLVENAAGKKAKAENFITKFARFYTPIVVILAVMLAVIPPLFVGKFPMWIHRALTFLVVSCPCALVISVPLSFFGGIGGASREGILIKGGNYMELLDKANIFVFDKTGTLTKGEFAVQEVIPKTKEEEILYYAAIAEIGSLHPIAKSILKVQEPKEIGYEITEIAGKGVVAVKEGNRILAGNSALMELYNIAYTKIDSVGSIVYVAKNNEYLGAIVISDKLKNDTVDLISNLHKNRYRTVMLTGDNKIVAKYIADKAGIDEYHAELLPIDKVKEVENIINNKKEKDIVAFVGDGINDAPVIMRADIGIAMGGIGSDSAIEAADVVLMYDKLSALITAKEIAHKTMAIVMQNIIFAISVKVLVLILSAFGIANMWMAVFADVGVAVLAILNSMRSGKRHISAHIL